MQEYEDDIDDYGDYEEAGEEQYEEAEEEEEAEYEEEEDRQPTKEELEYLELRQTLKDSIRKKMKRESGSSNSQEKKRKLPYDNFGSFFGPSRPVISSRVIQESKSLLENQQLASRLLNSSSTSKKTASSSGSGSKNGSYNKRPKVVNELKRKVEKIKDRRDYSFLFSDDAGLPEPKKEAPSRNFSAPYSESRSAPLPARAKQPLGANARNSYGGRDEKAPVSTSGQMHSKAGSSGSEMHSRAGSSGGQMHSRAGSSGSQMHSRAGASGTHSRSGASGSQIHSKPSSSTNGQVHLKPSSSTNGQIHSKSSTHKPSSARKLDSVPTDTRKQLGSNNGIGPGRPVGANTKSMPPKIPVYSAEKKASVSDTKKPYQSAQLSSSSKPLPSDMRQRVEQRKVSHEPSRSQMVPKHSAAPSKPQMNKPLKQAPPRGTLDERRPKKKPAKMSEDDLALSMIRKMFKTERFAGRDFDDDDDDSAMEANFDDIMREEQRSARIARKEDEEQLRLIEEEERQERMRKVAKKRKLSQHH